MPKDSNICWGNGVLLNATGKNTFSYLWSDGSTDSTLYIQTSGSYTVKVFSDTLSCYSTASTMLYVDTIPWFELPADTLFCLGVKMKLKAADPLSGYTYKWNTGDSVSKIQVSHTGQYSCTVTNTHCNFSYTDSINVVVDSLVTNLGNDTGVCQGGSIKLYASPAGSGYSYLWSMGAKLNSIILGGLSANKKVWLTVTDSLGCKSTDSVLVKVQSKKPIVNLVNDTSLCSNTSINLPIYNLNKSDSGSMFLWNNGATTDTIFVKQSGNYKLSITQGYCTASDSVMILIHQTPNLQQSLRDTFMCNSNPVDLSVPYSNLWQYLWSNGAQTNSIQVNTTGIYSVSVGYIGKTCYAFDTAKVTQFNSMLNLRDTVICSGTTYMANVYNPNINSYLWSTGDTSSSIAIKNAGIYWVKTNTICGWISDSFSVSIDSLPSYSLRSDTTICSGDSIILKLNKNTSNVNFVWNTGNTTSSIVAKLGGIYSVQAISKNGCSIYDSVYIKVYTPIKDFMGNDTIICKNTSITLDAGVGNKYLWSDNTKTQYLTTNKSGTYWCIKLDTNQCQSTDTITVSEYNSINADFTSSKVGTKSIELLPIDTNSTNKHKWYFGDGDSSSIMKPAHTYSLDTTYQITHIVSTKFGCVDSFSKWINLKSMGIVYNQLGHKINIYPNPFSDELFIEIFSASHGKAIFSLINQLGVEVRSSTAQLDNSGKNTVSLQVNKEDLPTGVYMLKVTIDQQQYYYKLLHL
ncbi:MAG: T9SS type A sorting domain-containing protein [Bacteroidetes bacterium]|nr:T9SS type A sorting domain-containing protein [Bacteroidota bacterium]